MNFKGMSKAKDEKKRVFLYPQKVYSINNYKKLDCLSA
jgi:hypothetical protein